MKTLRKSRKNYNNLLNNLKWNEYNYNKMFRFRFRTTRYWANMRFAGKPDFKERLKR